MSPTRVLLVLVAPALAALLLLGAFALRARRRRLRAAETALDELAREAALRIASAERRLARAKGRAKGRLLH